MIRFFSQLFNIHVHEWQRILYLYGIYFLFMVGIGWGGAVVSASFLTQVGIEFLPVAFVVEAIITVVAVAFYSAFVDRVPNDKLLIAILGVGFVVAAIGRFILAFDAPTLAFPILYLLFLVIANMFPLQWWNYIDEFYDTLTAKRAVPFIASGLQVGTIIAGLTLPALNNLITPNNVIVLWMLSMVGAAAFIWYMPQLTGDKIAGGIQARTTETLPYRKSIREGYDYIVKSKFLIWMAANTLFLTILMAFVGYQADKILLDNLEVTENLANFIARLMGLINFIMLPIQILMFSRIVSRMGVENTNLIFPVGSVTIVGAMLMLPANILIGSLGVFNRTAFRKTFQNPVEILMYNTIPLRVKGRIGAVIAGAVTPLGGIIGGLSLIVLLPVIKDRWQMAILMGGVAILYVGVSWILRREYTSALLQTLEDEDFSFLLGSATEVNLVDATTVNWLSKRLETADSDQLTLFIAQLLAQVAGADAVTALEPLGRHGSVRIRRGIADILVVNELRSEQVGRFYLELLKDEDAQVRRSAVEGLEILFEGEHIRFLNLALQLLRDDPSLDVKTQVMPALIRSSDIFFMGTAFHYLSDLLNDERADHRMKAVRVLEQIDDVRLIRNLIDVLHDEDDEVRLTAAITAERLAQHHDLPAWMHVTIFEAFDVLLHDPVERIRQAAILVIGHVATSEAFHKLLPSLTDSSLAIRHVTVEAFAAAGKASIPTLDDALQTEDKTREKYITAALARIDRARFRDYLIPPMRDNLRIIYHNHGWLATLAPYLKSPIVSILGSMLQEANHKNLEEVFYFLSTGYDAAAVRRIYGTLQNESTRPFAAEALESMANADVARLITVLYDPAHDSADLFQLHHEELHETLPTLTEILQTLYANLDDPWDRTMAVYMLGELGDEIPDDLREKILEDAENSTNPHIQRAASTTRRNLDDDTTQQTLILEDLTMLSNLEKVIFLKQVPLFEGMSVEELKLLAGISKEVFFEASHHVFRQGDIGETMYIIVNGSMGIELEDKDKDTVTRIATRSGYEFFGEMALFTAEPRSATVTAIKDTLTLEIEGDALMKLARQYPDLALGLIRVLSVRLRDASSQLAQAQTGKSRQLLDMFDKLDS